MFTSVFTGHFQDWRVAPLRGRTKGANGENQCSKRKGLGLKPAAGSLQHEGTYVIILTKKDGLWQKPTLASVEKKKRTSNRHLNLGFN